MQLTEFWIGFKGFSQILDYFNKNFIIITFGWYEGNAIYCSSTNNSLEAFN